MGRLVKCQYCGITDTPKEDMIFELVGNAKPVRKYYHKNPCYGKFELDKEFKKKEQIEKDELNEVLKKIYGVPDVPKQAWTLLEKLRGGNAVFGGQQTGKRYKQGYSYPLIKETFEHCSDTIEYWNGRKDFTGFMGAFKYALTIVIDKIYFVEQRVKIREKQRQNIEKHLEEVNGENQTFESNYKKTSKTQDVSDFLDD